MKRQAVNKAEVHSGRHKFLIKQSSPYGLKRLLEK